jgi:leucine dehydrogenase
MRIPADVFSPCALGAILTEDSIAQLQVPVVAGGANNQLAGKQDGERLKARGILYAPDYVINAGGIINVAHGVSGTASADQATVHAKVLQIPDRLTAIWDESDRTARNPARVADSHGTKALIGRG